MFQVNAICKFLVGAAMVCVMGLPCLGWEGRDRVLLWMVDDSATVDGNSMCYSFLVPYTEDYDNWNAVRVKVVAADGTTLRILDNWGEDEYGNRSLLDGKEGIPLGDVGGYWGAGNPSGVQSPFSDIDAFIAAECYMQAELGRLSWNYDTDSPDWTTLAYSKYKQLTGGFKDDHTYDMGSIAPSRLEPWRPTEFFTVNPVVPAPEPTTIHLIALGLMLVMLGSRKMPSGGA